MKKLLSLVLVCLMIAALPVYAENASTEGEAIPEYFSLEGIVTEIDDTCFILDTVDLGEVQVNFDEETHFPALPFACGQYAFVLYNGMMTRSLPPQVHALSVNVNRLIGAVVSTDEEACTIVINNDLHGEIVVHLNETDSALNYTEGDLVMVYNSGAMALSLPPQVNAALIVRLETLTGVITEITDSYIMISENDTSYQVNIAPDTTVTINSVEMKVGDLMTVLYNGMMTRSLPPQVSAIEITVDSVGVIE